MRDEVKFLKTACGFALPTDHPPFYLPPNPQSLIPNPHSS